ncbi:DNA-processing protein DprA [Mycoplasma simbae]|uniref:DNA-processing protein DprA n=1 Tax=Mycoplasma simbae TaxID=36744 RepID=UPI000495C27C|nr:DNA-processing protein DprA [Mycoplasma simbae]
MNELLVYFSFINKGNNYEIFKNLAKKKKVSESNIKQVINMLKRLGVKFVTVFDEEYPQILKALKYPPYVIYYQGDINLLNQKIMCITGDTFSANIDLYMKNSIESLAKQFTLITSDFTDIDTKIINEFKKQNQNIIHVLANGHSYNKPNAFNNNDLYISQYPPHVNPKLARFKERNLLIAALSQSLIIYGSKSGSGIINLASKFADLNKEVYCYPSIDLEDGNNFLLKNGANLITHIADINTY